MSSHYHKVTVHTVWPLSPSAQVFKIQTKKTKNQWFWSPLIGCCSPVGLSSFKSSTRWVQSPTLWAWRQLPGSGWHRVNKNNDNNVLALSKLSLGSTWLLCYLVLAVGLGSDRAASSHSDLGSLWFLCEKLCAHSLPDKQQLHNPQTFSKQSKKNLLRIICSIQWYLPVNIRFSLFE